MCILVLCACHLIVKYMFPPCHYGFFFLCRTQLEQQCIRVVHEYNNTTYTTYSQNHASKQASIHLPTCYIDTAVSNPLEATNVIHSQLIHPPPASTIWSETDKSGQQIIIHNLLCPSSIQHMRLLQSSPPQSCYVEQQYAYTKGGICSPLDLADLVLHQQQLLQCSTVLLGRNTGYSSLQRSTGSCSSSCPSSVAHHDHKSVCDITAAAAEAAATNTNSMTSGI